MLVALQELQRLGPPPPPTMPDIRFNGVTHVPRAEMGECESVGEGVWGGVVGGGVVG